MDVTAALASIRGTDAAADAESRRFEASAATLTAKTYYGVLRGLERLSQLIVQTTAAAATSWSIPNCPWTLSESPHFPHRGVLVDPARSFLSVASLEKVVDGLLYSSMNGA